MIEARAVRTWAVGALGVSGVSRASGALPIGTQATGTAAPRTCAVGLVDRRTGVVHRVNGMPLMIVTRYPHEAAAELLKGRDPSVWEARIDQIEP